MPFTVEDPTKLEAHSSKGIPAKISPESIVTDTSVTPDIKSASANDSRSQKVANGIVSKSMESLRGYKDDSASCSTRESTPASCVMVTENMLQEEERLKQEQENEQDVEENKDVRTFIFVFSKHF